MAETATDGERLAKETADRVAQAFAMNLQMGKAFMDAWASSLAQAPFQASAGARPQGTAWPSPWPSAWPQATPPAAPAPVQANGMPQPPFTDVTRAWLNAVSEAMSRTQTALQKGEALTPDAYMDIWSRASAEIAQAIVSDASFAALTGQWVSQIERAKGQAKKTSNEQLRELGFATHGDVEEVGLRLVELERRVHDLVLALEERASAGEKPADKPAAKRGRKSEG